MHANPTTLTERWLPVRDWEDIYEVSDLGRIRRIRDGMHTRAGRIIRGNVNSTGYIMVRLSAGKRRERRFAHKMVMEAFIGPRPQGWHINHLDSTTANNALVNLEYTTPAGNLAHMRAAGRARVVRGSQCTQSKLTEESVAEIRSLRGLVSNEVLAERYGVAWSIIANAQNGRNWRHVKVAPRDGPSRPDGMLTRKEAARYIGYTSNAMISVLLRKGIISGILQERPRMVQKEWLIDPASLDAFLASPPFKSRPTRGRARTW